MVILKTLLKIRPLKAIVNSKNHLHETAFNELYYCSSIGELFELHSVNIK